MLAQAETSCQHMDLTEMRIMSHVRMEMDDV